ncbi:BTAD domain-containing putative transcriptional regulator [Microbacterium sp. SS28]|uniref:nSTAND1 domain-containing NTPase n=1 Tax=Microbacterium sp. SS28 TaxID=2919948 RepID=UPI001FAA8DAC|nr:BTAD domain-containing putative transcriptional regulator [Microbacterium sp. SS28]
MVVKVLGPLETGTEPLSPRERTVLSALIVRAGATIAPSELAEAWWGQTPPRTWEQQVRNSIARIRARLGRSSIETLGWEYRLNLDPDAIDAVRFERLVSAARGHVLRGEHDRAVDAYGRALALWRGAPLQDVTRWEPGVVEAMRLGEIRASAEEELLDARLGAGEHRSVIADAERLLREQPLREDRWAIVALANYRANRQAEALAVLRRARERLADELGIEPGPRLASLELAMLRRDPSLDAPLAAAPTIGVCPYPGLRPFGPDDSDVFFGRDDDIEALLERVTPGGIVTIAGASGTGKSSLLLAGLIPRLRARGSVVEIVRPSVGGAAALRHSAGLAQLIAVDQAEEILSADDEAAVDFARTARSFLDEGNALILTVRSDALDRLRALPDIGEEIGRGVYLVGGLTDAAYRSAIEAPARQAGLVLEPGLVEVAVRDAGDRSSTLPHLSHALQETWARREGATLTVDGYQRSGGIPGAIAQSAEEAFRRLTSDEQSTCRTLLLRLIDRGADGVSSRRRVAAEPLLSDAARRRVLEALTRARLVTLDGDAVVVAHEAVATAWPRLDGWLEEDAEGARTLRSIESGAAVWAAGDRDDDDLLRGARLHSALTWQEATAPDLTPVERDFLEASDEREQGELRDLQERAGRDRRRNRILRTALAGAGVLLVAAIVAGSFAAVRGQEAAAAAENARIEAVVATSLALRTSDREVAALLAAEAYRRWPEDGRVRSALWGTMTSAGAIAATNRIDAERATVVAIPGAGEALAIVDRADGPVAQIVDAESGETLRTLDVVLPPAGTRFERDVIVSDDGSLAVAQVSQNVVAGDVNTCCWNWITFIDLATGEALPGSQLLRMRTSTRMVLDGESADLFIEHPITGDLINIDGRTGEVRASSPGAFDDFTGEQGLYSAIASIDAHRIATGTGDRIDVYDRDSLARIKSIPLASELANWAMISDGDGGLIISGADATARLDADTGAVVWQRPTTPSEVCNELVLLPDRDAFACSTLGAVTEHDVTDGAAIGPVIRTQLDDVVQSTVLDDSTLLLNAALSSMWFVLRLDGSGPGSRLAADGRRLVDLADDVTGFTPTMTAGGGRMQLWDFDCDCAVGAEADWVGTLGSGVIERGSEETGSVLVDLASGKTHTYVIPDLPDSFWVFRNGGQHTFVAFDSQVVRIDPHTGAQTGPRLILSEPQAAFGMLSVSETPAEDRAVVTWWDAAAERTVTSTFDLATGERVAPEIYGLDGSLVLSDEELITVSDETVQRVDLATHDLIASLPRAAGGSRALSVTPDGQTLLNVGWNHRLTLYDLTRDVVLGDPVDADSGDDALGGVLSADGKHLYSNARDGILVWPLDPAEQAAAACHLAGRELTASEWATYLKDLGAQHATCADALG